MEPTKYGGYVYPPWATVLGWTLSLVSISAIPGVAIYKLTRGRGDYATVSIFE